MRIAIAVPEAHVTAPVLNGALEAVTRLNEQLIRSGASPTARQLIEQGAVWRPEPPGDERFDHGVLIAQRGEGDCDDWAPLHAGGLRASGEDPGAKAIVKKSGEKRWHAVVQRSDGSIDDPSLWAGMPGRNEAVGVRGAWLPPMRERVHGVGGAFIATPHLALRPVPDRFGQVESWQARADLPWHWAPGNSPADVAMVTLHQSPVSDQAVVGALRGAWRLGSASRYAHPEQLSRLAAIADACEGASWEELAEEYGPRHANAAGNLIQGWFGKALLRKAGKLAKKAGRGVLKVARHAAPLASLIPGGGIATAAFNAASSLTKGNVAKQRHLPPEQRKPVLVTPARELVTPAPGGLQFMPYPYPLPYPVPGWGGAAGSAVASRQPGAAWPPR